MDHTLSTVARILNRSHRPVTERTLRSWVEKGLLPHPLSQGRGRGRGKIYHWKDRRIVSQAATIYDLLQWHGRVQIFPFPLWLLGYEMPLETIRKVLLEWIDGAIAQVTAGISLEQTEELADHLSELAFIATRRWNQKKTKMTKEAGAEFFELFWRTRIDRHYMPGMELLSTLVDTFARGTGNDDAQPIKLEANPVLVRLLRRKLFQGIRFAQLHLSLPRVREAVACASKEDLEQAGADLRLLIQALQRWFPPSVKQNREWQRIQYGVLTLVGRWGLPVLLALRQDGYAHWISRPLEWAANIEQRWQTDPLFRNTLREWRLEEAVERLG